MRERRVAGLGLKFWGNLHSGLECRASVFRYVIREEEMGTFGADGHAKALFPWGAYLCAKKWGNALENYRFFLAGSTLHSLRVQAFDSENMSPLGPPRHRCQGEVTVRGLWGAVPVLDAGKRGHGGVVPCLSDDTIVTGVRRGPTVVLICISLIVGMWRIFSSTYQLFVCLIQKKSLCKPSAHF